MPEGLLPTKFPTSPWSVNRGVILQIHRMCQVYKEVPLKGSEAEWYLNTKEP